MGKKKPAGKLPESIRKRWKKKRQVVALEEAEWAKHTIEPDHEQPSNSIKKRVQPISKKQK
jgi:hypothetical protein